jgi:hypothetical protein
LSKGKDNKRLTTYLENAERSNDIVGHMKIVPNTWLVQGRPLKGNKQLKHEKMPMFTLKLKPKQRIQNEHEQLKEIQRYCKTVKVKLFDNCTSL